MDRRVEDDYEQASRWTWQAVQQTTTTGRSRVRVIGTCVLPAPGFQVRLRRAPFQGSNPNVLLLDFTATPPGRAAAKSPTKTTVAYEETTNRHYRLVTIQPGGVDIAVQDAT